MGDVYDKIRATPTGSAILYSRKDWDKLIDIMLANGFEPSIKWMHRTHVLPENHRANEDTQA